jgi:hypothetical protein
VCGPSGRLCTLYIGVSTLVGDGAGNCESNTVHVNTCLFLNGAFESSDATPLGFCLCGWMESEVCNSSVCAREELLACVLDAGASINKREDQLTRTTRDLRTRVAKYVDLNGGIFTHPL